MNDVRFPAAKRRRNRRASFSRGRLGVQGLMVWHRRLGLATAVIVLLLAATGILLNHSHRLGLDESQIKANWVLRWYGFPAAAPLSSYRTGERWVSWTGSQLYMDDKPVMEGHAAPVGAVLAGNDLLVVAFPDAVVLVAPSGEIVERMGSESLPGKLERLGATDGGMFVVDTARGAFKTDTNMIAWQPAASEPVWSSPEQAPDALRDRLTRAQRGPGLSVERVLQDLHSGRIFGAWGPWLMDATALAFIVLAATGIYYWWTRRAAFTRPNGKRREDE